jgi:hypothetical protein
MIKAPKRGLGERVQQEVWLMGVERSRLARSLQECEADEISN